MALRFTLRLTEVSTRNLNGGKGWPARKADNLTAICIENVEASTSTACYSDSFFFYACLPSGLIRLVLRLKSECAPDL
jgi:hypothetical protein